MSDQDPERLGTTPEDQEATKAQQQSDLQAQREEHNRRVAPGGAEIEDVANPKKDEDE